MITALYFSLLVAWMEWPIVIGQYRSWGQCSEVREWLDRQGYETDSCGWMVYPQDDSLLIEVSEMPKETDA